MLGLIAAYGATLVAFLALDAAWLTTMMDRLYHARIGGLLLARPDISAAAAFYILYVLGILILAIRPARRLAGAVGRGALLGLVAYGTYDLTNQATLAGWDWGLTFVDMVWGTVVTGIAAAAGFTASSRAGRRD